LYIGLLNFNQSESKVDFGSLCDNFRFENFSINFDSSFLSKNAQLILYRDYSGVVRIINKSAPDIPGQFASFKDFLKHIKQQNLYHKTSFVYYDYSAKQVTLKRDEFGLCPSYYTYIENKSLVISTSLAYLNNSNFPEFRFTPNNKKIREYLDWNNDSLIYSGDTFLSNVYSVLPGATILLSPDRVIQEAREPDNKPNHVGVRSLTEIGEDVKYLLSKSIKNLIAEEGTVSCQLSGGLDSSSIAAMTRQLFPAIKLNTFYFDTETSLTDEGLYAEMVAAQINSKHRSVTPNENLFEAGYLHTSIFGYPDYMTNGASLHQTSVLETIQAKCKITLAGQGGDAVIGYGNEYLHQNFRDQNWGKLKEMFNSPNFQKLGYFNRQSKELEFYKTIYSLIATSKKDFKMLPFLINSVKASMFFGIPFIFFAKKGIRKLNDWISLPSSIINQDYTFPELSISEVIDFQNNPQYSNWDENIFNKHSITINEQFYLLSFFNDIRHVFPFYDKDLLEYCNAVPEEIKYDSGRRRGHLREAMKGILPEPVRTRTTKGNFGTYGRRAALLLYQQSRDLLTHQAPIWEYVNKSEFEKSVKLLSAPDKALYVYNYTQFNVFKTINLAIWLDILR
jgi:asparagine synthase (glutamine-hydrolysing)